MGVEDSEYFRFKSIAPTFGGAHSSTGDEECEELQELGPFDPLSFSRASICDEFKKAVIIVGVCARPELCLVNGLCPFTVISFSYIWFLLSSSNSEWLLISLMNVC